MQAFKVPSSETPGHSSIYRHPDFKDGTQGSEYSHIKTLYDLFQHVVDKYPKRDFLGTRKLRSWLRSPSFGSYEWINGIEASELVDQFGSGLDHVYSKYAPTPNTSSQQEQSQQQPLGIYSTNRPEWMLAEFAAFRSRRYSVGVCDSVGVGSAEFIINHSDIAVVVCSLDKIPRMVDRLDETPGLKVIISMDRLDCSQKNAFTQPFNPDIVKKLKARAKALGVEILDMDEVRKLGRTTPTEPSLPSPDDICTVCYTSGTAGAQKGVLITHDTLVHSSRGFALSLGTRDSTYLSFIPLVHSLDRCCIYVFMFGHVRVGFYSGDMNNLMDDIKTLKPTVLTAVPRVLNRIYDRIAGATVGASGLTGVLSRMGYKSKTKRIDAGRGPQHKFWDRLIFGKVAAAFGGRLRTLITGAASISPEVLSFFRASLSCTVIQGYGLTECMVGGTIQLSDDPTTGHVGVPVPGVDIRLRNVADMGYQVTDSPCPRGELLIRGPNVFSGYHKEPEKTKEAMEGEWLITGDVAQINEDGTITIIDRVKNIVKTGRGIWIAPERLESIYSTNRLIQSVFVHGDEAQRDLVAVVAPDTTKFLPWARSIVKKAEKTSDSTKLSLPALCRNENVIFGLQNELKAHAAATGLTAPEYIKAVYCDPVPFESNGVGFFTSTAKLRRIQVLEHYQSQLNKLFATLNNSVAPSVQVP
ncbi:medium-chain fatty acid-CoA ligase faa2 [Coemansia sp. RSA 1365]|nr:medium-chain fatty acid-CoA ligase faa2 [Coemansia sp. RSA 1365]